MQENRQNPREQKQARKSIARSTPAKQQEALEQKRRAVAEKNNGGRAEEHKDTFKSSRALREKSLEDQEVMEKYVSVSRWFLSLCWMQIPVIGFVYVLVMAFSKKTPPAKKSFAMAYILYRVLVLLLTITIIYVLFRIGVDFADELLRYVQ